MIVGFLLLMEGDEIPIVVEDIRRDALAGIGISRLRLISRINRTG